jgi:CelD/BcsL family acetyltransferase involved in cellulose biosynthesis
LSNSGIEFELVTETEGLASLRADWDALWERAALPFYELSHSVVWHAWTRVAAVQGHELRIVVGRVDGRAVLIWPAISRQERFQGFWRVVGWLGRDPIDFGAVLVESDTATSIWMAAAVEYLAAKAGADVLSFACVPEGSALYSNLQRMCPGSLPEDAAPYIDLRGWETWDAYEADLSKSFRKSLRRRLKRLTEAGEVEFVIETDYDLATLKETVDWITCHKSRWLDERGMEHGLLTSAKYADSMVCTLRDAPAGKTWLTKLLIDGVTIAADVNLVSGGRCYSDYGSFDLEWAKFSPGALLMRESIKWAFSRNINYLDLGRGADDYKLKWCSGIRKQNRFLYPCNLRGRTYVFLRTSKVADIVASRRTAA